MIAMIDKIMIMMPKIKIMITMSKIKIMITMLKIEIVITMRQATPAEIQSPVWMG